MESSQKDHKWILETDRLRLRELSEADYGDLCEMLQDEQVMYAYEHAFSDEEAQAWLNGQLTRYRRDGFGLWAVILKETGEMVGETGITWQRWRNLMVPEIGYHLKRRHWHRGYAAESAIACKAYAFERLRFPAVYSMIRDTNTASQRVAQRNGMTVTDTFVKHYWGMDMPHLLYSAEREE